MRLWNATVGLCLAATVAAQAPSTGAFGSGCTPMRASFFEAWAPGAFDLPSTATTPGGYRLVPHGRGFYVSPGSANWQTPSPLATNVATSSSGVSNGIPLGFAFPFHGGQTTSVWIHVDGFVCFAATPSGVESLPPIRRMFEGPACLAAFWSDFELAPSSRVTVEFDASTGGTAVITWDSVREVGTGDLSRFQIQLHASGQVDVVLLACQSNRHTAVSGWSPGHGAMPCEAVDLSTLSLAPVLTFPDLEPPVLQTSDVPRLGSTVVMETMRVQSGCRVVACAVGALTFDPGIDLTTVGAPQCLLHSSCDAWRLQTVVDGTVLSPLLVPNDPQLVGGAAAVQSIGLDPTANPAGVVLSNGYRLVVVP